MDRQTYPCMPRHDVHRALWGLPCHDVARHFDQRWNYAKGNKAPYEETIPPLMPQLHVVIPHYMGIDRKIDGENKNDGNIRKHTKKQESFLTRSSCKDIPLLMPEEADGFNASKGGLKLNGLSREHGFHDQASRPSKSPFSFQKSKVQPINLDMPMKCFVDDLDASRMPQELSSMQPGIRPSDNECWETQDHSGQFDLADGSGQVGSRVSCRCQL